MHRWETELLHFKIELIIETYKEGGKLVHDDTTDKISIDNKNEYTIRSHSYTYLENSNIKL